MNSSIFECQKALSYTDTIKSLWCGGRSCSTSIFTARTRVTDILIEDNIDCSCGIEHRNLTLFTVKEDQVVKLRTLEAITVGAEVSGIVQFYDQMLPFTMLHIVKRRARTILIRNHLVQHYLFTLQKCVLVQAQVQQIWCQNLTIIQVLFI